MAADPVTEVIATDTAPATEPLVWRDVREQFAGERWYWLATGGPDGRPHVRPVLAVSIGDLIVSTTSPSARKGRDLEGRADCSITARAAAMDIVVEGTASWIEDDDLLQTIAAAYDTKYGWPVTSLPTECSMHRTAHQPPAHRRTGLT